MRAKLPVLDDWNERRAKIAAFYRKAIDLEDIVLPFAPAWTRPAWHLFVIRSSRRNQIQQALTDAGIGTLIHYPVAPFDQPAYRDYAEGASAWPIASQIAREVLSIPMGPHFSFEDAERVADVINVA